jgi:aspartate-semialdehyde dehydrogenase
VTTPAGIVHARTRRRVAVFGATGAVGQTFVRLLANHPWFELTDLAASERSAGRVYGEATRWLEGELPEVIARHPVVACDPSAIESEIVFSALDSAVATEIEAAMARAGKLVLSNARNFRMDADVPLLIPEINPDHLALLQGQRSKRGWPGAIVTNPNCAAVVAAMALAPLHQTFGVRQVFVTTMQAVSGAGYPGVPTLDILGNVIPLIREEEGKIETETRKILGRMESGSVVEADIRISAQANRVPVEHGHTVCMSIGLDRRVSPEEAEHAIAQWRGDERARNLPSACLPPIRLASGDDRPQPRRDVMAGGGMQVTVGRVRSDPILDLRLVALGHNTIRGAAGASVLNAELLLSSGAMRDP